MEISVLLADAQPVRRLGLRRIVEKFGSGIRVVGEAGVSEKIAGLVEESSPDLVVLALGIVEDEATILLCRDIKDLPNAPRIVLYGDWKNAIAERPDGGKLCYQLSGAESYVAGTESPERLVEALRRTYDGEVFYLGP